MRLDQIARLRDAVEAAAAAPNTFVEWIDDDESQHVVVGIVSREAEDAPVAQLSGGGFVPLAQADACDFRLVSPAVPEPAPPVLSLKDCDDASRAVTIKPRTEISIIGDLPDYKITILIPSLPPDNLDVFRCAETCQPPKNGADFGACPVCGRLVAWIYRENVRTVYPAEGTKGVSRHD